MENTFDGPNNLGGADQGSQWSLDPSSWPEREAAAEEIVNYYFPVEIVVAGSLAPQERETIQALIYQDLHDVIIAKLT